MWCSFSKEKNSNNELKLTEGHHTNYVIIESSMVFTYLQRVAAYISRAKSSKITQTNDISIRTKWPIRQNNTSPQIHFFKKHMLITSPITGKKRDILSSYHVTHKINYSTMINAADKTLNLCGNKSCYCDVSQEKRHSREFTMYHVTNISKDESSDNPDWVEIRPNVADDKTYDGDLVGLPVASFTTTRYEGGLPTFSTYPRNGIKGKYYWRVAVPFRYDDYDIFLMNDNLKQIHLLCLTKDSTAVENILSAALEKRSLTDKQFAMYFPNNRPNEYTDTNIFVNVAFIQPIQIPQKGLWDTVKRSGHGHGELVMTANEGNIKLLDSWGRRQLKSSWCDAIKSFDNAMETNN